MPVSPATIPKKIKTKIAPPRAPSSGLFNKTFKFELDSFKKKCLLEGLDDIALSLEKTKNIESFENKMSQNRPWL